MIVMVWVEKSKYDRTTVYCQCHYEIGCRKLNMTALLWMEKNKCDRAAV